METSTESREGADRILAKLVKKESKQLRDALGAGDYAAVRRCARQLGETLKLINKELEARTK
jgi:DNA-binding FadR family transcriptional regulator